MKPTVMDAGLPPTKSNLFNAFTKRVKANLHTIVCMRYSYIWFYDVVMVNNGLVNYFKHGQWPTLNSN